MAATRMWLLFSYRLPRTPTRLRLAVWRRLRRIGAVAGHDAIWILPDTAESREHFDWLAEEIEERRGHTFMWAATSLSKHQDERLTELFRDEASERYEAITATALATIRALSTRRHWPASRIRQTQRHLGRIERALRAENRRDFFQSNGRAPAEAAVRNAMLAVATRLPQPLPRGLRHAVGNKATLSR